MEVQLCDSDVAVDAKFWDHIVECYVEVPSGKIVVGGCFEILDEDAFSINLSPGNYAARIYYGGQYECGDGDVICTGRYLIKLWPTGNNAVRVIKRSLDLFAQEVC